MSTISVAPYSTTNSEISFLLQSDGFVAGTVLDNPANRYQIEGGLVASGQSTPLWGGIPVELEVPAPGAGGSSSGLGSTVLASVSLATIDAFCVFNQASAGVITPSSTVPLYPASTSANFARLGCGLWMVLPVKAADVATIAGGNASQAIYYDGTNNYVTVTSTSNWGPLGLQIIALNTNSKLVSYSSGLANWTTGDVIIVRL